MARKPRRLLEEKVFITRELSKEVKTLTIAKFLQNTRQGHKSKRLEWVKKCNFSNVKFTNKCHATLDAPDEWAKCWISTHHYPPVRVRLQQGSSGVIFWPAIIDDGSIRTFRTKNGVNIDSPGYYAFLNKHFPLGRTKQPLRL